MLRNGDAEPAGLAAIGRDITERKALEARLSQSEKLESIGRLAGGIAHDFNNLLTVILGNLGLVLRQEDPALPTYGPLLGASSAAQQCADLCQELLAIGRKQHVRPELISLNAIITDEEAIIRDIAGQEVELITSLDPSLRLIYADPAQIRRLLANLVSNARDAMLEGGTLTIATSNVDIGEAAPDPAQAPGRYVQLSIRDTGIGLTPDVKERMFDPFFTTKAPGKGTGLGLATVQGIISQNGGSISARSDPGEGTTMEILLPSQ
jgi:signal transduction histidine kinase